MKKKIKHFDYLNSQHLKHISHIFTFVRFMGFTPHAHCGGQEGGQASDRSSRLGFNICKCHTGGYFEGDLGTISSCVYSLSQIVVFFQPKPSDF